ncbi:MAG: ABC transporter ATP-binding protein, partial [Chromatiales bacterium]|nr:ABC transporter ATP-binding protein [Chromatiales bacterium]
MVIVSHDRHLLRVTCDRLLLVHGGGVDEFDDELDAYPAWLNAHARSGRSEASAEGRSDTAGQRRDRKRNEAEQRKALQPLRKAVERCEADVDRLHARQAKLEAALADTTLYTEQRKDDLQALMREKSTIDRQLDDAEAAWMEAAEALENAAN